MEILIKDKEINNNLIFNKICLLFGENNSGKSKIINLIKESITSGNKSIKINGNNLEKSEYDVLYFDEETDFSKEFKFTKSNFFKSLIYDDIIKSINEKEILKEVNNTFDIIDKKVNNYLNDNLKELGINQLKFDINIPDINKVIEKFTDIYFNDYLLSNENISKSIKRKLIYQLLLLFLESQKDKKTFVIIDNFDIYLDSNNTIEILRLLQQYSLKYINTYFILTSNKNLYKYITDDFDVYKVNKNNLIEFNQKTIINLINKYILITHFQKEKVNSSFEEYYQKNTFLINDNDINYYYKKLFLPNKDKIGELLINNNISLINYNEILNFESPFIICDSLEQKLFLNIFWEYIDNQDIK